MFMFTQAQLDVFQEMKEMYDQHLYFLRKNYEISEKEYIKLLVESDNIQAKIIGGNKNETN